MQSVGPSNQLNLDSDLGSIGSLANPIHAVLVQWDCSGTLFCSGPHPKTVVLTGEAGTDFFLDLTTIRRDSTTAHLTTAPIDLKVTQSAQVSVLSTVMGSIHSCVGGDGVRDLPRRKP